MLHTTGGYLLGTALTHKWVFDIKEDDVYWCTADVGWVTGHSYIMYGPLCNGTTVVMYEGAPNQPKEDRFWEVIAKYKVTVFYTAPTALRALAQAGPDKSGVQAVAGQAIELARQSLRGGVARSGGRVCGRERWGGWRGTRRLAGVGFVQTIQFALTT